MTGDAPGRGSGWAVQAASILWLRGRLTYNQWVRRGKSDGIAGLFLVVLLGVGIILSTGVGYFLGSRFLSTVEPVQLLFGWDGLVLLFLFFWVVGLLTELQRSASLDLAKLMHLPVSLGQIFIFNFAASWVTPSIVIVLPGFLALTMGLAVSCGSQMLLLIPVILGFFFVVTSLTYLLRGWIISLMADERRRRTVMVVASVFAILLVQGPNFYLNILHQRPDVSLDSLPSWFSALHLAVPVLWLPLAARALAEGTLFPALAATVGSFLLGTVLLGISYCSTVRFHRGGKRVLKLPKRRRVPGSHLVSARLPWVSEGTAAIALATFQSYLRAPEVKMALFGQLVMNVAFGIMLFRPGASRLLAGFQPGMASLIVMISLFGAVQMFFNIFGFDREGFRSLVLAPVERRDVILGKNLATFPLVSAMACLVLTLAWVFGLIRAEAFFSALLSLAAGCLLFAILGNWLSVMAPYRMATGSLKPTKVPPRVTVMLFFGMLLSPLAGAVIFSPALLVMLAGALDWPERIPYNLLGSIILVCLAGIAYVLTLVPLAALLEGRERKILDEVTREIE